MKRRTLLSVLASFFAPAAAAPRIVYRHIAGHVIVRGLRQVVTIEAASVRAPLANVTRMGGSSVTLFASVKQF
jgi:hypothetical protein